VQVHSSCAPEFMWHQQAHMAVMPAPPGLPGRSSRAGTEGRWCCVTALYMTWMDIMSLYGCCHVSSSHMMMAKEYTSAALSMRLSRMTSGAVHLQAYRDKLALGACWSPAAVAASMAPSLSSAHPQGAAGAAQEMWTGRACGRELWVLLPVSCAPGVRALGEGDAHGGAQHLGQPKVCDLEVEAGPLRALSGQVQQQVRGAQVAMNHRGPLWGRQQAGKGVRDLRPARCEPAEQGQRGVAEACTVQMLHGQEESPEPPLAAGTRVVHPQGSTSMRLPHVLTLECR
jgi:hypothetical protein